MHYRRWLRRGGDPGVPTFVADPVERWWSKVDRRGPDECWPWTGGADGDGYGRFTEGTKTTRATRWGYRLLVGQLADDEFVCHSCDNPSCCNPAHWFKGTVVDNQADMTAKGRQARGEGHGRAKLSEADVAAIRSAYAAGDTTHRALADEYGVARSLIGRIITGEAWR